MVWLSPMDTIMTHSKNKQPPDNFPISLTAIPEILINGWNGQASYLSYLSNEKASMMNRI